jgi:CheY-like chemotaxis protein
MGASTNLAHASTRRGRPDPNGRKRPNIDGPRVLVVDDDPFNLMVAAQRLSLMGIKPLLAADGAEAVARARELRFDLILMDIQMPVLDGFAATAQIRCFERELAQRRVPVVAYTANLVCGDLSRLRESGFDAVLEKPAGARAMRECVTRGCLPGKGAASAQGGPLYQATGQPQFPIPDVSTRNAP